MVYPEGVSQHQKSTNESMTTSIKKSGSQSQILSTNFNNTGGRLSDPAIIKILETAIDEMVRFEVSE